MKWIVNLVRQLRVTRELAEEVQSHIEERIADLLEAGMPEHEARRQAMREFGNVTLYTEIGSEVWRWTSLEAVWKDLRYALRAIRRSPGFTVVAVITLGLGIGANTTIFSFIDAFFLRPLPVEEPYRLVSVYGNPNPYSGFCYPEYTYFRDHTTAFMGLAAHYSTAPLNVVADGDSKEATGAVVSANYFSVLGVKPLLGRFFATEEDKVPDRDFVAVISYGLWQRRFSGDPAIVGKRIRINGNPFSIIGVTSDEFHGVLLGSPNEMWIPTMVLHVGWRGCDAFQFDCRRLDLIGRLAPGRKLAEAQAEISTLAARLAAANPVTNRGRSAQVLRAIGPRPGSDRRYYSEQSRLLAAVAGILLLIACANVAGLLLARSSARSREIALRLSIGASRSRLIRQLLTESLLLAGLGGALGLALSLWAKGQLLGFYSANSEGYQRYYDLSLDPRILGYSIALALFTGLLFGILPAIQSTRQDLTLGLKEGAPSMRSRRGLLRGGLVAGQVALSLALLVGAGLSIRSSAHVSQGANFDPNHVALLRLRPGLVEYSPAKAQAFQREVLRRLEGVPGVESVSFARGLGLAWLGCACDYRIALPGQRQDDAREVAGHTIAPRYFETLRIPLIEGRDFNGRDRVGSPYVAIVNETLAHWLWPRQSPLGRTLWINDRLHQVVGVAKDARLRNAMEGPLPFLYTPFWQDDQLADSRMCIRVAGDAAGMLPRIRHEIASVDPNVPISEDLPMTRQVESVYMPVRLSRSILTCAGTLALFLTAIGLYGILAFSVNRRRCEVGIRMALGALPASVLKLVLKQGMVLVLVGAVLGMLLSLALARLLSSWLYGVPPYDPATYLLGTVLLGGVAFLACVLPAQRATRIDPLAALRHE